MTDPRDAEARELVEDMVSAIAVAVGHVSKTSMVKHYDELMAPIVAALSAARTEEKSRCMRWWRQTLALRGNDHMLLSEAARHLCKDEVYRRETAIAQALLEAATLALGPPAEGEEE